jgi:two-component system, OmpR family, osmolarity sensor histidine kinase EnvZ
VPLRSPSLFWRTFLLIVLLILASLIAWAQSFRVLEREPRARQIAQQVVSIVNITRAALLYSDATIRRDLLAELADNEGIRIVPLEAGDQTRDYPDAPLVRMIHERVRDALGPQTRIAAEVNGVPGHWVSFSIEEDAYWVFIERDPLLRDSGTLWVRWAIIAALLSLLVAVAITRVVNLPLARLSLAARELGAGRRPTALPDKGPAEIRTVNQSFNRMVADLDQLEQDRAILLAGISHDLRTPLTRLRLELEINPLPEETRAAMAGDIEQIDAIVRQFLDYARSEPQQPAEQIDLSALVQEAVAHVRLGEAVTTDIAPDVHLSGSPHRTATRARQPADQCQPLRTQRRRHTGDHRVVAGRCPAGGDRNCRPRTGHRQRRPRPAAAPVPARRHRAQRQYRRGSGAGDRGAHCAPAWRSTDAHACRQRGAVRAACAPDAA